MYMPPEVQKVIQDFARPLRRSDWRTCKDVEAGHIKKHTEEVKFLHKYKINCIYDDGWAAHCIVRELHTWTLYGLRKIIREPQGWIHRIESQEPDPLLPEWYLHLYNWVVSGDPRWHWEHVSGEWILDPM